MKSGWTQLEEARKLSPNMSFRFSIFTWDQEHRQKAASSSTGNSNTDLVSYVEFQKHYKSLTMSVQDKSISTSKCALLGISWSNLCDVTTIKIGCSETLPPLDQVSQGRPPSHAQLLALA